MEKVGSAEMLEELHLRRNGLIALRGDQNVLGSNAQPKLPSARHRRRQPRLRKSFVRDRKVTAALRDGLQKVHAGRTDETCNEFVCRVFIDLPRRPALLNPTAAKDDDLVGKGHGFGLVVEGGGIPQSK